MFKYTFVKFLETGGENINTTEYGVCEIKSGLGDYEVKRTSSVNGLISLGIGSNKTLIVTTNLTSPVIKFRDGWVD